MFPIFITSTGLAIAAVLLISLAVHAAESRTCLVVGVSDGDTITARCGDPVAYEQIRVRIAGIDAPEKGQRRSSLQRAAHSKPRVMMVRISGTSNS